jgi:(p)ppGpp synthase/HD superfamily hydrolase
MTIIEKAQDFAHRAHDTIKQVRKYTGEPYWIHTDDVALRVTNLLDCEADNHAHISYALNVGESMICAAHLHDYREDVVTELQRQGRLVELRDFESEYYQFNPDTHLFVTELTDVYTKESYPKLNRQARHKLENERLGKISRHAKTIKLADLISNTKSIVENDKDFARVYLREKLALLPFLSAGASELLNEASNQVIEGFAAIGEPLPIYGGPD